MVEVERNDLIGYIIYYADGTTFKTRDLKLTTWREAPEDGIMTVIKYFSHKWGARQEKNHWQILSGSDFYFAFNDNGKLAIGMGDAYDMTLRGNLVDDKDVKGGQWINDKDYSKIMLSATSPDKRYESELGP